MVTPNEQNDVVKEARELLVDFPSAPVHDIERALFADAVERERRSPFFGHSKKIAHVYARAPELLKSLLDEVDRLRGLVRHMNLPLGD